MKASSLQSHTPLLACFALLSNALVSSISKRVMYPGLRIGGALPEPTSIAWYEHNASTVAARYESGTFDQVQDWLLSALPDRPGLVLMVKYAFSRTRSQIARIPGESRCADYLTLVYSAGCRPEGFLVTRTFPFLTRRFTIAQTKLRFFVPTALARAGVVHLGCF